MRYWFLLGSMLIIGCNGATASSSVPRVSLITSMYKGDRFIKHFMKEIVKQTIFNQCELILINANSPGDEEAIIAPYLKKYPNIVYIKLDKDPGLYAVWNMAIKRARGKYIMNTNLDDGLAYDACEVLAKALDDNPDVDLVYADCYFTQTANKSFYDLQLGQWTKLFKVPEFSYNKLVSCCFPHNHPMWRKSMHVKYGFFDESYTSSGDYEMWLRAALGGAKFKRIPGILGYFYRNPYGISGKSGSKGPAETARIQKFYSKFTLKS